MIDVLVYRERHPGHRAIDGTRRCIQKMAHPVVPARFEDVEKSLDIAVDIGVWIDK